MGPPAAFRVIEVAEDSDDSELDGRPRPSLRPTESVRRPGRERPHGLHSVRVTVTENIRRRYYYHPRPAIRPRRRGCWLSHGAAAIIQ
jgi:hypothetical protein